MTNITKNNFIDQVNNAEHIFLLEIDDKDVYLLADIEYGGDYEVARIEQMKFRLNQTLTIKEAISECRGNYSGGITFIEYKKSFEKAQKCAINDMILLSDTTNFIVCCDNELKKIKINYPNQKVYIYVN